MEQKTAAKSPYARLLGFATPHRDTYILSVLLAVLGVAAGMVPYFMTAQMIVALLDGTGGWPWYLARCGVAAAAFLAKVACMNLSTSLSHRATFAVISDVRRRLTAKLSRVPMGYLHDTPSGQLKATLVERVDNIEGPLAHVVPEMTSNLLIPLCIIVYLFTLDWRMALISLITIPIGCFCYAAMMRDYPEQYGRSVAAANHMNATTVEYIGGIEVIKAFNQSAASYARFTEAVKANSGFILSWMKATQSYTAVALSVWPAVFLGLLPVGCLLYMGGSLGAATFVTILILSLGIIGPMLAAMMFTDNIARIGTVVGELTAILDQPELLRPTAPKALEGHDIVLQDVDFSYGEEPVLQNLSLTIPGQGVTAIVGPSGGGKSTIAKLIASLWDAGGGAITLGGVPLPDIPLEQLMDNIAYVAQDNFLFNDTVRNNIRMGRRNATDAEVEAAAKASGCHAFITRLEHGYDTICGGAGGHLSGGERQRIAIARAMLKNAPIVILDESTAYTDPENEAVIQEAVARLVQGRCLIIIAHRLSTITDADKIVVVRGGRVEAEGTHEQLLVACPLYQNMWRAHVQVKDREAV